MASKVYKEPLQFLSSFWSNCIAPLSKLGAWETWEIVEVEKGRREDEEKNVYPKKNNKNTKLKHVIFTQRTYSDPCKPHACCFSFYKFIWAFLNCFIVPCFHGVLHCFWVLPFFLLLFPGIFWALRGKIWWRHPIFGPLCSKVSLCNVFLWVSHPLQEESPQVMVEYSTDV